MIVFNGVLISGAPFSLMPQPSKSPALETVRPEDRRRLIANEQVCIGWIQVGLAFLAVALGTKAAFGLDQTPFFATAGALLFVVASVLMFVQTSRRALSVQSWIIDNNILGPSCRGIFVIAASLTVGAVSTGILFWLF
ncbi:putative membrane protein [Yoonia maricola]|uniref:Putative membrane protein n=1 Tax=Yoonia maricola TaxID=420999 RepID=A0A2M8W0M9_9RHOB|nr:putative membrane protein [Yoonia maricola]